MIVKFPVGDWSNDGHNQCEWFRVETNLTLERLRETHFSCKEILGFDIGAICGDYENDTIDDHIIEILENNNIEYNSYDGEGSMDVDNIIELWLNILKYLNPYAIFSIVPKENDPTINFYGFDEHKRHLSVPGYGVHYP